jgi:hypothetical protein
MAPKLMAESADPQNRFSVVHVARREAGPRAEALQHGREELLRVDAGERPLPGLAACAGGSCGVDDVALVHGLSCFAD